MFINQTTNSGNSKATVTDFAKRHGFNVTRVDGEWRIVPPGGSEAQAYYTDDNADAIGTMRAMLGKSITTNAATLRPQRSPLYAHYPRETNPQPAIIRVFPAKREAVAEVNCLNNCITFAEWHGREYTFRVNYCMIGNEIADFLESEEVQGLLEVICNGYSECFNGQNFLGHLDSEANDAKELLEQLCERVEGSLNIWSAAEWIADDAGTRVTATMTQADLEALASEYEALAVSEGVVLEGDTLRALSDIQERA